MPASAHAKCECPALSTFRYLQDNNRAEQAEETVKKTGLAALCEVPMQLLKELLGVDATATNEEKLGVESAGFVILARPGSAVGSESKLSGLVAPPRHREQARSDSHRPRRPVWRAVASPKLHFEHTGGRGQRR